MKKQRKPRSQNEKITNGFIGLGVGGVLLLALPKV